MSQTRDRAESFTLTGWRADADEPSLHFDYSCTRFGAFRETVSFPMLEGGLAGLMDDGLSGLAAQLHAAIGVSYYKSAAAREVKMTSPWLTPAADAMIRALYTDGLAEFYVRAGLPYPPDLQFSLSAEARPDALPGFKPDNTPAEALVAFGGGKDSYVAADIARRAGLSCRLCSVVLSEKVAAAIQRTAREDVLFLTRRLDPTLREVNAAGAFNGHVPITAINSLMLVILGRLTGAGHVIFANERSADEPTMQVDGVSANHQYSKSSAFEALMRDAIAAADRGAPAYYSVLRPFSEIWIAREFANLTGAHDRFTSCNRNFQIAGPDAPRWCGDCAKCAFTSLMLAPYLKRQDATRIFGDVFPDKDNLVSIYRELLGLGDSKPWDCVGTIDECRATLYRLSQSSDWHDSLVVRDLLPAVMATTTPAELDRAWADGLAATERHFVPADMMEAANAGR